MNDANTAVDGAALFTTASLTRPTAPVNSSPWLTASVPATPLVAGNYFVCINQAATGNSVRILTDGDARRDGRVSINGGALMSINTGFAAPIGAPRIRLLVDLPMNDMVLNAQSPFAFPQIPTGQVTNAAFTFPTSLVATARNAGIEPQTNVKFEAVYNGINFGASNIIASITPGATSANMTITPPATAMPTAAGVYNMVYTLSADAVGANPSNYVATFPLNIGEVYARDATTPGHVGVGMTTTGGLGNIFPIYNTTAIKQVQINFESTVAANFNVAIYRATGATTIDPTPLFITETMVRNALTMTVDVPATVLLPGNYYLCVHQTTEGQNVGVSVDPTTRNATRALTKALAAGTTSLTSQTGFGALGIRMIVDDALLSTLMPTDSNTFAAVVPMTYTMVPTSQNVPAVSARVQNLGWNNLTNLAMTVSNNGTSVGTSNTIAALGAGVTETLELTPTAMVQSGQNVLAYQLTATNTLKGNTVDTTRFLGTNSVFAQDNPVLTSNTTIGNSNGTTTGLIYTITEETTLSQVLVRFADTDPAGLFIARVEGTTIVRPIIDSIGVIPNRVSGWQLYTLPTPRVLAPGDYFIGLRQNANNQQTMQVDNVAGKTRYTRTNANLTAVTTTATSGVPRLRLVMEGTTCPAPTNLAYTNTRPNVGNIYSWEGDNAAFTVRILRASDDSLVYSAFQGPATSLTATATVPNLQEGTTYKFRVIGQCWADVSDSTEIIFTTLLDTTDVSPTAISTADLLTNVTTQTVTVTVTNTGSLPLVAADTIWINLQVNGPNGIAVTDTFRTALTTAANATFTCAIPGQDFSAPGNYTITATTTWARDQRPENDVFTKNIVSRIMDAGIVAGSLTSPVGGPDLTNENVTLTVQNFGTDTIRNLPVALYVEGALIVRDTIAMIPPTVNNTVVHTFSQTIDMSEVGPYNIMAITLLNPDNDRTNDTLRAVVAHGAAPGTIDAAAWAITSPTANSTAFTANENVTVNLRNLGYDDITSLPVQLFVNGTLAGSTTITDTIPTMGIYSYTFTGVDLSTPQTNYNLMIITNLAGDTHPANDTARITVRNTRVVDVRINAFSAPATTGTNMGMQNVTLTFENRGTFLERNIPVELWVNGDSITTETIDSIRVYSSLISPNRTEFTFATQADLSAAGAHTILVKVKYPHNQATLAQREMTRNVTNTVQVGYTVNLSTNTGESPEGAVVTLSGTQTYNQTATGGTVTFPAVNSGTYNISIAKAGFDPYTANGIVINAAGLSYTAELIETIVLPENLNVVVDNVNGTATFTWNPESAEFEDYFEGFEGTTGGGFQQTPPVGAFPAGWTRTADTTWGTTGNTVSGIGSGNTPEITEPRTGARQMIRSWLQTGSFTWAFSPGFEFTAGTTYTISFWYRAPGYQGEIDRFKVQIANTTDRTGTGAAATMVGGTTILTNAVVVSTQTQLTFDFTPTTSGLHYIGFHCMTPRQEGLYVQIDDLSVVQKTKGASSKAFNDYTVYLDGVEVATNVTENQYVFTGLVPGNYIAGVKAVYTSGASAVVTKDFTIEPVNINTLDPNSFTIHPNPVADNLFIQTTLLVERIEIYDLQGKLVKVVTNNTQVIPVSDLKSGVYMIKITTDKGISTQRFVKN
jgi:hypothetical protein